MAEIGYATLGIIPSFDGFERNLTHGTSGTMSKVGGTSGTEFGDAAGKSAGSRFGSVFKTASKAALLGLAAAGAAAGAVAFKFGKDALGEAREAQKVGALTANTIKATGGAAKVSAAHVANLSGAISEQVGIDDEVIQRGANMLLTFKNVRNEAGKGGKVFDRTTRAITDMAAGMAGGAGGDIDLKSASILMGKALNDPVKGLTAMSRVGITFTDQQKAINTALVEGGNVAALNALGFQVSVADFNKAMEDRKATAEETVKFFAGPMTDAEQKYFDHLAEGGHTLEAQQNILKEVNSQFGGAAAAQATDAEKLKVAWGNFQEEVGTELLPMMDDLVNVLRTKAIPKAREFFGWVKDTGVPAIKDWADDLKPVVGFTRDLVGYLNDLPKEVKIGGLGAIAALIGSAKLRGGSGLLGSAGGALGLAKPMPVFVTNAGFGAAGGATGALGAGAAGTKGKAAVAAGAMPKKGMTLTKGAVYITAAYFAADAITKILGWEEEGPKQAQKRRKFEEKQGLGPDDFTLDETAREKLADMFNIDGTGLFGLMRDDKGLSNALLKSDPTRLIELQKMLRKEYGLSFQSLEKQGLLIEGTAAALKGQIRPAEKTAAVFKTFPKDLKTEVMLNGADRSMAEARGLVKQYDLTPKQKSTLFKVLDIDRNKQTMKTYTGILRDAGKPVSTHVGLTGVPEARTQIRGLSGALADLASDAASAVDAAADVALGRGRGGTRPRDAGRDRNRAKNLGGGP